MQERLRVENLTVDLTPGARVLEQISFSVGRSEAVGIVGESGSGKTTLLHAIAGLLTPPGRIVGGSLLFEGQDLARLTRDQRRRLRGKEMAVVFQDMGQSLTQVTTIGDQFVELFQAHGKVSRAEALGQAREALVRVDLNDPDRVLNSYPFELSGGMKQRIGIAFALGMGSRLILADEPTSALDSVTQGQVVRQFQKLQQDHDSSLILVTHDLEVAAQLCGKIGVLQRGRLVEWGTTEQVLRAPQADHTKQLLGSLARLGVTL